MTSCTSAEPGQRRLPAEQLDRLEQRGRDPSAGDRDPHRSERVAGFEPELLDQRRRSASSIAAVPSVVERRQCVVRCLDDVATRVVEELRGVGGVVLERAWSMNRKPEHPPRLPQGDDALGHQGGGAPSSPLLRVTIGAETTPALQDRHHRCDVVQPSAACGRR